MVVGRRRKGESGETKARRFEVFLSKGEGI